MESWQISSFYINTDLQLPKFWNLSRKHVRIQTLEGKFIKLNKYENRLNAEELREHCIYYAPKHVYFSVLNWLFPERIGKKYKGNYCLPIGTGEYVVDVDSYLVHKWHPHYDVSKLWNVCLNCLENSRDLTISACQAIEWYYSKLAIVFSGRSGFHIHVLDFDPKDWTTWDFKDMVKCHAAARFKFSKTIGLQAYCFDRAHFILSTDPMRLITVPNTLNGETGLKCVYIGNRKDLEQQTIENLLWKANPLKERYGYPEPNRWVMKTGA